MKAEAFVLVFSIFFLGGGLSLIMFLLQGQSAVDAVIYPQQVPLSPIAMFALSIGVMGAVMLTLAGRNLSGDVGLGRRQFYVGYSLVGTCFVLMELLCNLAFR